MSDIEYLKESVTKELAEILVTEYKMTIEEALSTIVDTKSFALLMDTSTGLYRESSGYSFEYLKAELADNE